MIGRGRRAEGTTKSQGSTGRKSRRGAADPSPPFGWEPLQKYNPYRDTYRRHRKLFLGLPLAAMLIAIWFVAGAPKKYESTTALWFDNPPPQTSSITQGTDLTGITQPPAAQAQVVLNELLTTRDFRIQIGKSGPLQGYLATHTSAGWGPTGLIAELKGTGSLSDRVVKALGPSSVTTRVVGPQVLAVAVHSTSPTVAAGTLKALIREYKLESNTVQTAQSKASLQYYRAQKVGAQADLSAATKQLTDYVDAHPGAVPCTPTQSAANSATCDVELKTLSDARKAAVTQLVASTQQYNQAATSLSSLPSGTVKPVVIDPPRVPTAPIKGPKNIVLAAVAGLFAGFLISLLAVILITGAELRAAAEVRARRLDDEREARQAIASRGATAPALLAAAGPEPPLELVDFPAPPPAPPQVDPPVRPRAVEPGPVPHVRPVVTPPPVVEPPTRVEAPAAEVETPAVEPVPVEPVTAAAAPPPPARAETPPPIAEPVAEEARAVAAVEPPVEKPAVTERRRAPRAPKQEEAVAEVPAAVVEPVAVEPPAAEPAVKAERRRAPRAPKQEEAVAEVPAAVVEPVAVEPPAAEPAVKAERRRAPRAPKQEEAVAEVPAAVVEPVAVEPPAAEPAVKAERRRAPRAPKQEEAVAEVPAAVVEPVAVEPPAAEPAVKAERRRTPRAPKQDVSAPEPVVAAEPAAAVVGPVPVEVAPVAEVETAAEKKAAAARERRRAPRSPKQEAPAPAVEVSASAVEPVAEEAPAVAEAETAAEKKGAAAHERRRAPRPPKKETPDVEAVAAAAIPVPAAVAPPVPVEEPAVAEVETAAEKKAAAARDRRRSPRPPRTHEVPPAETETAAAASDNGAVPHETAAVLRADALEVPGPASDNGATPDGASAEQAIGADEDARFSGTVIAVRNDGSGRAHRPIWTVRQVAGASGPPVGGLVHLAADPGHDGTVLSVHDSGNGLATYEVEIPEVRPSRSKTAEPGVPPLDPRWVGSEVTFAPGPSASARRREERRAVESRKGQSGELHPSELPGKIPSVS